ncbi:FAD-binding oxidoreductase [Ferruginivarius sediminum]|uniref:D-lactate dehydrogenase (cytochrome) n=1 Tax=Ferruginivarius sediminum TaxID=2661937 RepID=A0A369T8U0_9PROT|nr:FAD-linked oxidase C-terminal domain-containing protein [Ferruginivarius sediminum]RDD61749.1 FAD-binding protein [Ferruginivarius sediminum]
MAGETALEANWLDELGALLGDRLSTSQALREQHGRDESYHPAHAPDAVVFATSTEEVAEIVRICARHRKPVIPFGTGTSLEGHVAALSGGVSLDLSRMNEVLEVNAEDLDCKVQAGVTRKQLNDYIRDTGLFFPIDPGADASLGGMAATGASGTNAVRYGTMRENVLGLTVVMADGSVVHTGGRARKSSAGYDLTRLMVGSEGTLGVITEVRLRLHGIPEAVSSAVCAFPTLEGAVDTAMMVIQSGIPVARMELLDEVQMDAVNRNSKLDYPVQPTIFFEFHGTEASAREQAEMTGEIARDNGGTDFRWATRPEERGKLWQARHDAFYAAIGLRPGAKGWPTDVCVPISRLAECVLETKRDIEETGLLAPIVGHVGDGNFHLVFVVDPDDKAEMEKAAALNDRLVERALRMEGTCTGEHGIGYGKMHLLEQEHGDLLPAMAAIKRALDPLNIMNPGKIVRVDAN